MQQEIVLDSTGLETLHNSPEVLRSFADLKGRIGIFGGSFDPIHKGHVAAALSALRECELDAVVFVPAERNPLKAKLPGASDAERLLMVASAIRAQSDLYVSPIQFDSEGPSYTVDLLRTINSQNPELSLYLIVGSDNVGCFTQWKAYEEIAERSTILSMRRGGRIATTVHLPPEVADRIVDLPVDLPPDISSTQIRALAAEGKSFDALVEPEVAALIRERRLYQKSSI